MTEDVYRYLVVAGIIACALGIWGILKQLGAICELLDERFGIHQDARSGGRQTSAHPRRRVWSVDLRA